MVVFCFVMCYTFIVAIKLTLLATRRNKMNDFDDNSLVDAVDAALINAVSALFYYSGLVKRLARNDLPETMTEMDHTRLQVLCINYAFMMMQLGEALDNLFSENETLLTKIETAGDNNDPVS